MCLIAKLAGGRGYALIGEDFCAILYLLVARKASNVRSNGSAGCLVVQPEGEGKRSWGECVA
jgi:hypothetical protein